MPSSQAGDIDVLVVYWGRRGLSNFALGLVNSIARHRPVAASICLNNEIASEFHASGHAIHHVITFGATSGAIFDAWRVPFLRRSLLKFLMSRRPKVIIDVLPHIWMPFVRPIMRRLGATYVAIAHDAQVHPGDIRTRLAKQAIDHTLKRADRVIALSRCVADGLITSKIVAKNQIKVMFHPDLGFEAEKAALPARRMPGTVFKLAFVGRILPYKGLSLFIDTIDELRVSGLHVHCGVFGEGDLGPEKARLEALGAEVINRWLDSTEIASVFNRYDALLATHLEASQSGVVAAALGAGLPVVATPVGGLVEQIEQDETGLFATAVTANALARSVRRLVDTPDLYCHIRTQIARQRARRSMDRFAQDVLDDLINKPAINAAKD